MLKKHFVIFKAFFGITAHTADAIKNDGVGRFNLAYVLIPIGSVLFGSGVEFFDDSGGGVESGNVGNLSSELLVLGADAAIGIDHNITFLSVLNVTMLAEAGMPQIYTQQRLGHKDISVTLKYYTHLTDKMSEIGNSILEGMFSDRKDE